MHSKDTRSVVDSCARGWQNTHRVTSVVFWKQQLDTIIGRESVSCSAHSMILNTMRRESGSSRVENRDFSGPFVYITVIYIRKYLFTQKQTLCVLILVLCVRASIVCELSQNAEIIFFFFLQACNVTTRKTTYRRKNFSFFFFRCTQPFLLWAIFRIASHSWPFSSHLPCHPPARYTNVEGSTGFFRTATLKKKKKKTKILHYA